MSSGGEPGHLERLHRKRVVATRKIRRQVRSSRSPFDENRVLASTSSRQPLPLAHKGKHGDDDEPSRRGAAAHAASSPANEFTPRGQEKEKRRVKRDQTLAKGSERARQFSLGARAQAGRQTPCATRPNVSCSREPCLHACVFRLFICIPSFSARALPPNSAGFAWKERADYQSVNPG